MDMTLKRLATMVIAEKRDQTYSQAIHLIRCIFKNRTLIHLRGTQSTIANPAKNPTAINMMACVPSICMHDTSISPFIIIMATINIVILF